MELVQSPKEINGYRVVQDYDEMLTAMQNGEEIYHWEFGTSMSPMFPDKGYCRVRPINTFDDGINRVKSGDAVFCEVNGHLMVHMVWLCSNMDLDKPHFLIGSTSGSLYGWTDKVYGIAFATPYVEDVDEEEYFENNESENDE